MDNTEKIIRLEERREEMEGLLDEIKHELKEVGGMTYERAERYWLAHIEGALRKETRWLGGGSFITMDDTIRELEDEEEPREKETEE